MVRGWILALGAALIGVGCVPRDVYESTRGELERAKLANADLVRKYNELAAEKAALEAQLSSGGDNATLLARIRDLEAQKSALEKELSGGRRGFTASEARAVPGAFVDRQGIALPESVLFSPGSAQLKPEAYPSLDRIVELLRTTYPNDRIIIEGHTDNQELRASRERWKHNMRLSCERAASVFEYLVDHGIPETRFMIHGCAYIMPLDPGSADTEEGRRRNRRVVLHRSGAVQGQG